MLINKRASKTMSKKFIQLKGKIDKSAIIIGDVNTLSLIT